MEIFAKDQTLTVIDGEEMHLFHPVDFLYMSLQTCMDGTNSILMSDGNYECVLSGYLQHFSALEVFERLQQAAIKWLGHTHIQEDVLQQPIVVTDSWAFIVDQHKVLFVRFDDINYLSPTTLQTISRETVSLSEKLFNILSAHLYGRFK